jgi:molecular chaperone HtpG
VSDRQAIPFHIEVNRVIELLARQIYQSPLALLRENSQNAFDAILMRQQLGQNFEGRIDVKVTHDRVAISDNGIGMTADELKAHYWRAGSSGKNTEAARAAGVVGTFGIGAMANFGVANALEVETESATTGERTRSSVERAKLSATEDCIALESVPPTGTPGTTVTAYLDPNYQLAPAKVTDFLREFVSLLPVSVFVNDVLISKNAPETAVQRPEGATFGQKSAKLGTTYSADVEVVITKTGEVWVGLQNILQNGTPLPGLVLLRQGTFQLKTYRSWFGLSTTSVASNFSLGGIANLQSLQPTAGREALTTESLQGLQTLITEVEAFLAGTLSGQLAAAQNQGFMEWAQRHGRFDLCGKLTIRVQPDDQSLPLEEIQRRTLATPNSVRYYDGNDLSIVKSYASAERPVCVVSRANPRRRCEVGFLQGYCKCERIDDVPKVVSRKPEREWSIAESALAFRIVAIVQSDYFVDGVVVAFGKTVPQLPMLVEVKGQRADILLDPESSTVSMMLQLYRSDPAALTSMAKDFVRSVIFPRISNLVPSSTRQGAEAFLKLIKRPKEIFEYDTDDLGNLPDIWKEYLEGRITLSEAATRSVSVARQGVQYVDRAGTRPVASVVADVLENDQRLEQVEQGLEFEPGDPLPAITRIDKESDAKLLTISDQEPAVNGYRCFIALTERASRDYGDFFLQPHRTEIVWSGQTVLYVFQHHSGAFGLYYELQAGEVLSAAPGGRAFPTSTIVIKNQVYIPVPEHLQQKFIPQGDTKKRFDVRCDLLYPDMPGPTEPSQPTPSSARSRPIANTVS